MLLPLLGIRLLNFFVFRQRDCLRPRWIDRGAVRIVVIRSGSEDRAAGRSNGGDGEKDGEGYLVGEGFVEEMLVEYSLCDGGVFHGRGGVKVEISSG